MQDVKYIRKLGTANPQLVLHTMH